MKNRKLFDKISLSPIDTPFNDVQISLTKMNFRADFLQILRTQILLVRFEYVDEGLQQLTILPNTLSSFRVWFNMIILIAQWTPTSI